jgi:hypothetical protein
MHWSVERSLRGVGVGVAMVSVVVGGFVLRWFLSSVSSYVVEGFMCSHEIYLVCCRQGAVYKVESAI